MISLLLFSLALYIINLSLYYKISWYHLSTYDKFIHQTVTDESCTWLEAWNWWPNRDQSMAFFQLTFWNLINMYSDGGDKFMTNLLPIKIDSARYYVICVWKWSLITISSLVIHHWYLLRLDSASDCKAQLKTSHSRRTSRSESAQFLWKKPLILGSFCIKRNFVLNRKLYFLL